MQLLEELGLSGYFIEVVTGDRGFARKPDPEALLYLIDKYDLDKENTYYIGDRLLDVQAAQRAGIQSISLQIADGAGNQHITSLLALVNLIDSIYS